MSLFDYPRINVKGTLQMNPGTANNDDYAGSVTFPDGWGPYTGETLALIDSKRVEARTYGMSDEDFIAWVQKAQMFDVKGKPGQQKEIIPAEWNYYGGMSSQIVQASVIGVQAGPGGVHTSAAADVPVTNLIGSSLAFSGHFTDVNSEGSPPATQFFIDSLTLKGSQDWLSGSASKGACQWLNFYRNVNLTADGGAGGYVYHVMRKGPGNKIDIPGFEDPKIVGVIFRYYLYASAQGTTSNSGIEAIYQKQGTNPAVLEIVGTFAPLYEDEAIVTTPTGRLMVSDKAQIPTPAGTHNNGEGGLVALAPAVLAVQGNRISADFSGTFPDYYQADAQAGAKPQNPKFDFGPVSLVVSNGSGSATIGPVDYADTDAGDERGWVLDFDISSNAEAQEVLSSGDAAFTLVHATLGDVLRETDYYFVSNQQAIYTEQHGSGTEFLNQGTTEPATISVFHRGEELPADSCPPITLWQYRSIPLQSPGDAEPIAKDFKPGQPISVDTGEPGNFLFTFSIEGDDDPPVSYNTFMNPPYITNSPSISLRILPNEDFSEYYVEDPDSKEPVGNDLLTFDVVYQKVLRTYYLLYPVMNNYFALNSESAVSDQAQAILDATDPALWMSSHYMPRTRDMSASRRQLLRAWCRKVPAKTGSSSQA